MQYWNTKEKRTLTLQIAVLLGFFRYPFITLSQLNYSQNFVLLVTHEGAEYRTFLLFTSEFGGFLKFKTWSRNTQFVYKPRICLFLAWNSSSVKIPLSLNEANFSNSSRSKLSLLFEEDVDGLILTTSLWIDLS